MGKSISGKCPIYGYLPFLSKGLLFDNCQNLPKKLFKSRFLGFSESPKRPKREIRAWADLSPIIRSGSTYRAFLGNSLKDFLRKKVLNCQISASDQRIRRFWRDFSTRQVSQGLGSCRFLKKPRTILATSRVADPSWEIQESFSHSDLFNVTERLIATSSFNVPFGLPAPLRAPPRPIAIFCPFSFVFDLEVG